MKKFFVLIMPFLLTVLFFSACSQKEDIAEWEKDGALKILAIGNSFSEDAMEYVWSIANSLGIENVKCGHLYIGGSTLDQHYENAQQAVAAYDYRVNTHGSWQATPNYKLLDAIKSDNWDFITIQQASHYSGLPYTFSNLDNLVDFIGENAAEAQIAWHMTWAYQQNSNHQYFHLYDWKQLTMYNKIVETVQSTVLPNENISKVIPSGTAIQNARTSALGDTLTRDGYHLSIPVGRYIAGLSYIYELTGIDISNVTFSPVEDEVKSICIQSVKNAVKNPYARTEFK